MATYFTPLVDGQDADAVTFNGPLNELDAALVALAGLVVPVSGARVYNNTVVSIPNAVNMLLTYDSERWDTHNYHDLVTNPGRLTVPATGYYLITAAVGFTYNATGLRSIHFRINGAGIIGIQRNPAVTTSNFATTLMAATVWQMNAGDYVEAFVYQDSGGALDTHSAAAYSHEFAIQRV